MPSTPGSLRFGCRAGLLAALLLLAGCLKENVVWAPDGARAVILTADGLRFCSPGGELSPALARQVYAAAWLPDSRGLVLARRREVRNFADVASALGPERAAALVNKARSTWSVLRALPRGEAFDQYAATALRADATGILAYLRAQPDLQAELKAKLGDDWKEEDGTLFLHEIVTARVDAGELADIRVLHVGLADILSLRISPNGAAVAFTRAVELSPQPNEDTEILIVPLDGTAAPRTVAQATHAHPDWTADSRALLYLQGPKARSARFGSLVRRQVLDASARLAIAPDETVLGDLRFEEGDRVRCRRDGSVLFSATPDQLPRAQGSAPGRRQLFLLEGASHSTLRPALTDEQLPRSEETLTFFELDPSHSQVLLAGDRAEVWLLNLGSGTVERIAAPLDNKTYPAPAWRAPGEFTFVRRPTPGDHYELVLRRGAADTVLSRTWDPAILGRMIE